MIWPASAITDELQWIGQYGKSKIWALEHIAHSYEGDNLWSPCAWGTCQCPEDGFVYAWGCWCTEGQIETTWNKAMSSLEGHMLTGFHK